MPIIIPQRFSQRYDTVTNWTAKNPVLWSGEIAYGTDGTGKVVSTKVGDGTTSWTGLPEAGGGGVPSGGTTGQIIVKQSATDGDAAWQDPLIQSAGTGIDITSGVISSTLGSIAVTNDVANYASLPTLSAGDAGQYWVTRDTGMAYRWDGSAWPADGSGIALGTGGLMASQTVSGVSTVDFTGLPSGYDFEVVAGQVSQSASAVLAFRVSRGGSWMTSTSYNTSYQGYQTQTPASATYGIFGQSITAGRSDSFRMLTIGFAGSATDNTIVETLHPYYQTRAHNYLSGAAGTRIDGLRIYPLSGAISGKFRLYGYRR